MKKRIFCLLVCCIMLAGLLSAAAYADDPPEDPCAEGHSLVHKPGKAATCTEAGTKEHYKCAVCKATFDDDEGTTPLDDTVIPATGVHNYVHKEGIPATCTQDGTKEHYKCAVCKATFDDDKGTTPLEDTVIPATGVHDLRYKKGIPATCTQEGTKEHYKCAVCKATFADEKGNEALADTIIPAGHTFESKNDETNHWQECSICGEKKEEGPHVFGEWATITEPTATDEGSKERSCACGFKQTETIPTTGGDAGAQEEEKFTVSFHPNGGTGSMKEVSVVKGGYTLPACGFVSPEGKHFAGWSTAANGVPINGTAINIIGDITLYALWEQNVVPTYVVSFRSNGGTGKMNEVSVAEGKYTLPACGFVSPVGKHFVGWSTVANGAPIKGAAINVIGDIRLYAVWEDDVLPSYVVSFDANGGRGSMGDVSVLKGSFYLPKCGFSAPWGKQFKGWSNSPYGPVIYGRYEWIDSDTTLYAIWEKKFTPGLDKVSQTGDRDNAPLGLALGIMGVMTFGGVAISRRKEKNSGEG